MTYGIASSGFILDFMPLNETAFESYLLIFTWIQTWIRVNNIGTLTPEGWFGEGCRLKGGNKNYNVIWMPYNYKGTFVCSPAPPVTDLVLTQLGGAVHKRPNNFPVFICTKLMMPVWKRLLFKMADLVVYGLPGGDFGHLQCTSCLFLVLFLPSYHTSLGGSGGYPRFW